MQYAPMCIYESRGDGYRGQTQGKDAVGQEEVGTQQSSGDGGGEEFMGSKRLGAGKGPAAGKSSRRRADQAGMGWTLAQRQLGRGDKKTMSGKKAEDSSSFCKENMSREQG